ncbi:hypothetical protein PIB30_087940 [Stylosanthes scabra]|uniref:Exocyst subunit Exo70 family protein n=1 Tax=Stylosanthes scabra TaxID=79078 RepID=A0ABU6XTR7_9FABA|nr:hypothetical protein [Stylosanthes scabra]
MISCSKQAKLVLPNGGIHGMTTEAMRYVKLFCLSQEKWEPVSQEYLHDSNRAETSFSLSPEMGSMLKHLERKLRTNCKNYKDPALRYFFMMINRRFIQIFVEECHLITYLSNDWFQNNAQKAQENLELYYRSSWNKVVDYLKLCNDESLVHDVATEPMKEKLLLFNSHFKKICALQSTWLIHNEKIRKEIITSVENMLLPAYGKFIGKFHDVLAKDAYETSSIPSSSFSPPNSPPALTGRFSTDSTSHIHIMTLELISSPRPRQ